MNEDTTPDDEATEGHGFRGNALPQKPSDDVDGAEGHGLSARG